MTRALKPHKYANAKELKRHKRAIKLKTTSKEHDKEKAEIEYRTLKMTKENTNDMKNNMGNNNIIFKTNDKGLKTTTIFKVTTSKAQMTEQKDKGNI